MAYHLFGSSLQCESLRQNFQQKLRRLNCTNLFDGPANELMFFSHCVHLPVIPLYTQNTFDFSCWSPDEIMRLSLHNCTCIVSRRAKFCSLLGQFFRAFQFFPKALTRLCHGIVRIVSSPFSSPYSVQFKTLFSVHMVFSTYLYYLASFLALGRGRSFAIFATFSAVNSCSVSFSFMLCFR